LQHPPGLYLSDSHRTPTQRLTCARMTKLTLARPSIVMSTGQHQAVTFALIGQRLRTPCWTMPHCQRSGFPTWSRVSHACPCAGPYLRARISLARSGSRWSGDLHRLHHLPPFVMHSGQRLAVTVAPPTRILPGDTTPNSRPSGFSPPAQLTPPISTTIR
jgi:hypothetical protein